MTTRLQTPSGPDLGLGLAQSFLLMFFPQRVTLPRPLPLQVCVLSLWLSSFLYPSLDLPTPSSADVQARAGCPWAGPRKWGEDRLLEPAAQPGGMPARACAECEHAQLVPAPGVWDREDRSGRALTIYSDYCVIQVNGGAETGDSIQGFSREPAFPTLTRTEVPRGKNHLSASLSPLKTARPRPCTFSLPTRKPMCSWPRRGPACVGSCSGGKVRHTLNLWQPRVPSTQPQPPRKPRWARTAPPFLFP